MMGPVIVRRSMPRLWVAGRYHPGIWWRTPKGRLKLLIPLGRKVESVYGRG